MADSSEQVQLPPIGGGAAMSKASDEPTGRTTVGSGSSATRIADLPRGHLAEQSRKPLTVSHQSVLESNVHEPIRGRGDRRERQERETTRERSRRVD